MSERRSHSSPNLLLVLLMVAVLEMAVYRLLAPALAPRGGAPVPAWHSALTYLGLFLYYFASALAVGVVCHQLWQILKKEDRYPSAIAWPLAVVGGLFALLAAFSIVAAPSGLVTFLLEAGFVLALLLLVASQLARKGDVGARVGVLLLAAPLVVHFYLPLAHRFGPGEEVLWTGLSDQVDSTGRWLVLLAALATPYCFAPKPFIQNASRGGPALAAMAVALMGTLIIRHDYAKGMELAQNGLGFTVDAAAPGQLLALYLLALSALTWTLASTLSAATPARRNVGVGIALVVVGGYSFSWPLQFLLGLAGILGISRASTVVGGQEERAFVGFAPPPIANERWQGYVNRVVEALRSLASKDGDDPAMASNAVTLEGEEGQLRTHWIGALYGLPLRVTIDRIEGSIVGIDVRCGEGECEEAPVWSLYPNSAPSSPTRHPEPPGLKGREVSTGSKAFDDCFRVLESRELTGKLFSEEELAEAVELLHGWVALWPSGTLRYQIYPGRGAPLDTPVPITALSFQNIDVAPTPMIELLEFLARLARRAHDTLGSAKE